MEAGEQLGTRRRWVVVSATVLVGALVVAAAAAAVLSVWLRAYAPLDASSGAYGPAPAGGLGTAIQPMAGSGGKPVFIPSAGATTFVAGFSLENTGRFAVTIDGYDHGAPGPPPALGVQSLRATFANGGTDFNHPLPVQHLRLDPGDVAFVVASWQIRCAKATEAETYTDRVTLHYSYLSIFSREQTVVLPFAVTLRCVGGPPTTP